MHVYKSLDDYQEPASIVTIGTFDGVHLAHQRILSRVIELSKQKNAASVLLTFWPHPRRVIEGAGEVPLILSSISEKIQQLEAIHLDHLIITPFTREFSELEPEEFIREILVKKLRTKKLVIGYDHRFGKNRSGSFELLKALGPELGYEVEEISKQTLNDSSINSTAIRRLLLDGHVEDAAKLLGRNYSLSGIVVKGKQLGRTIGYPTANINPEDSEKLVPFDGVYAVKVKYDNTVFGGMMNIGNRPTVNGTERTIEVFIFDFDKEIYGEKLSIEFITRMRDQIKFNGLDSLKEQLALDEKNARKRLR